MRLAWHIVRKDLFRLRWILLLWTVVLVGGLALVVIQSGLDGETYYPFWIATNIVVTGFLPLFPFGLVMGLFHDDPVSEIDAFWITRPISGGVLLLAKTLALLALSLVPVVVTFPFWLTHDYGILQLGQTVGGTLLGYFLIVAGALPFAVVSPNGSKFVMNVMLGAGGVLLLFLCLQLGNSKEQAGDSGLLQSKAWLVVWLWIVASLVVALNQFLRRRIRSSLTVMAVAVAAGVLVSVGWSRPLSFLRDRADASDQVLPKGAPTLSVKIDGEICPTIIVGQVPLRDGASASLRGVTLKVQSVFVDFTGELEVAFSEAAPQPMRGLAERLPGAAPLQPESAHYLLINPADGVILPLKVDQVGNELSAAAMRFKHGAIKLRPGSSWQGKPPADFKAWLQNAWLIKVLAVESTPFVSSSAS